MFLLLASTCLSFLATDIICWTCRDIITTIIYIHITTIQSPHLCGMVDIEISIRSMIFLQFVVQLYGFIRNHIVLFLIYFHIFSAKTDSQGIWRTVLLSYLFVKLKYISFIFVFRTLLALADTLLWTKQTISYNSYLSVGHFLISDLNQQNYLTVSLFP